MRAYAGVTATEVKDFLESGALDISDLYAATGVFIAHNSDLDEEEVEYTLSLVAAEDALDLIDENSGAACVLAFEIPDSNIESMHEMSVTLRAPLTWEEVQCAFLVSDDGEELTWFATQEIANNLQDWLA